MFDPKQFTPAANGPPAAAMPPLPHVPAQSANVLDRLSVVFKHRRLALTVFVVTVGVMMAQTYATIPLYRAKSQILIQDERSTAISSLTASDPSYWQDPEPYYNTQYRILQSRGLARRVVKRLEIQNVPEFNGTMAAPGGPLALVRGARAKVTGGVRSAYTAITGRGQAQPAEAPAPDETEQEAALVGAFLSRVQVVPERGTRLVDVYFQAADPAFAATAADTLAEEYVQQNLELKLGNIQKSLLWLNDELRRQQLKITQSEGALTDYRSQQNAPSLDNRQNIVVARLNQLNDAVTKAQNDRIQKENIWNQVRVAG
ncbi:MAG: Wzz/FepE/Etk N-terminal domain-containing protein, partial [Vicinamibacterales bacterium]